MATPPLSSPLFAFALRPIAIPSLMTRALSPKAIPPTVPVPPETLAEQPIAIDFGKLVLAVPQFGSEIAIEPEFTAPSLPLPTFTAYNCGESASKAAANRLKLIVFFVFTMVNSVLEFRTALLRVDECPFAVASSETATHAPIEAFQITL